MYAEPEDLDHDELVRVLRSAWGIASSSLAYLAVGFGTHHYRARDRDAGDWFVNVDDLPLKRHGLAGYAADPGDALERALHVTVALRAAGLGFVHAPILRPDGGVLARLGDRYTVSVYEFVNGTAGTFGAYACDEDRRDVHEAIGALHASTGAARPGLAYTDALEVPGREALYAALGDLDAPWTSGPYAEQVRELLRRREDAIRADLERHDRLAARVRSAGAPWVLTHGEPHAGNLMRRGDGTLILIDWDTVAFAPRERDLVVMRGNDPGTPWHAADREAYCRGAGCAVEADENALAMYALRWTLTDIAATVAAFRAPHGDDENTRVSWAVLQDQLA